MANPPPTLVSTFEILFTPQLPTFLGPPVVQQVDEFVVKGFFLTISNPNPNSYVFDVGFHCNVNPSPVPATRTLASAVGFLDDGSTGTALTISPGATGSDFSARVPVSANGTVLVGILPAFFTGTGLAAPVIESRGWVDIRLPAIFKRVGKLFEFVAQSATPVSLLLTPEQRLTFLPRPGDVATAVEAQSAFALPLASGAAAVAIPPQPPIIPLNASTAEPELTEADLARMGTMLAAAPAQMTAMLDALAASSAAVQSGNRTAKDALHTIGVEA